MHKIDGAESGGEGLHDLSIQDEFIVNDEPKGVVRFDSRFHSDEDLARMSPYVQMRVQEIRRKYLDADVKLVQTAPFPDDGPEERRALIAVKHRMRLVD